MTNSQSKYGWVKNVEVRYQGDNILFRLLSIIAAVIELILGIRKVGQLADSADTFKLTLSHYNLWVFKKKEEETYIPHGKINAYTVGFGKQWFIFKRVSCSLYVSGMTPVTLIVKDASEDELKEKFGAVANA